MERIKIQDEVFDVTVIGRLIVVPEDRKPQMPGRKLRPQPRAGLKLDGWHI
ncbi:MAG: hypothetical protein ACRD3O_02895 [Terriglobia bacterium]